MAGKRAPGRQTGSKNKKYKGNNRETMELSVQSSSSRSGKTAQKSSSKKSSGTKKGSGQKGGGQKSTGPSAAQGRSASGKTQGRHKGIPNEITGIIMLALGVFLVIAFHTKVAGVFGEMISGFFKGLFGLGAFVIPYLMVLYSVLMLVHRTGQWKWTKGVWMLIFVMGADLVNSGRFVSRYMSGFPDFKAIYDGGVQLNNGGLFGTYAGGGLYRVSGAAGLYIVAAVLIIISFIFLFKDTISIFAERSSRRSGFLVQDEGPAEKRQKKKEKPAPVPEPEEQLRMDHPPAPEPAPAAATEDEMIKKIKEDQRREGFLAKMGFSKAVQQKNSESSDKLPKWPKKISGNQKNILNYVLSENEFGPSEEKEGFGLGNSRESLHQRKDFNRQNKGYKDTLFDVKERDYEGMINGEPWEGEMNFTGSRKDAFDDKSDKKTGSVIGTGTVERASKEGKSDASAASPDYEVGGESVATAKSKTENADSDVSVTPSRKGRYKLPPLELLKAPSVDAVRSAPEENLNEKAKLLEDTLKSFNVDAKVVNVISGPSVTRYEIQPAIGVKVSRITSLSDDIALNMRASSIRIEAPIPGKAAVGIEIENANREPVTLREIIGSSAFRTSKSKLAFSVGRDIGGNAVVADLGKMPHLLIAGATGSGKSVCINTIIASILYKARPEEVKMILIDPKMVELGNYNGIPHLLIPVVTDASKAASALNWAVAEMTDRYKKFAANKVRDIGAYNQLMKEKNEKDEILPQIVIIIDELSDLMMVASSQVEDAICRLAQLARAAGMHLIVATQRPSVDVITGLIKANIPSRIAFMVSSQIDSRTIIDMPGAEKLVGNGDMLFKPQDLNKPKRIQGPFISDAEVTAIIEYVKSQGKEAEYDQQLIDQVEKGKGIGGSDDTDELLSDAVGVVVNAGQASVSMLQRRFRIGYNRAARIVDIMEERGIVGPPDGARPRQVLITEAEYENLKEEGAL